MHPRVSVSAICTYRLDLGEDLEFWRTHGIDRVGVSVAKLESYGWDRGLRRIETAIDEGLQVANLIGLGPFHLQTRGQWAEQRHRLEAAVEAAAHLAARCIILTTGPAGSLGWNDAAAALGEAIAPIVERARELSIPLALEHTNSLRVDVGFVHTLRDAVDLARRLGLRVCMEVNACWAERDLATTIEHGIDVIEVVQLSDFAIGTLSTPNRLVPGDGDIPLRRILAMLAAAGYEGAFDLELIGPRIDEEGYAIAIPRAITAVEAMLA